MLIKEFIKNEEGVTAIEYAVIGVAMAAVLFAAFGDPNSGIRQALTGAFKKIELGIKGPSPVQ